MILLRKLEGKTEHLDFEESVFIFVLSIEKHLLAYSWLVFTFLYGITTRREVVVGHFS